MSAPLPVHRITGSHVLSRTVNRFKIEFQRDVYALVRYRLQ